MTTEQQDLVKALEQVRQLRIALRAAGESLHLPHWQGGNSLMDSWEVCEYNPCVEALKALTASVPDTDGYGRTADMIRFQNLMDGDT